jgi:FtsH-binding integral membrane protein
MCVCVCVCVFMHMMKCIYSLIAAVLFSLYIVFDTVNSVLNVCVCVCVCVCTSG